MDLIIKNILLYPKDQDKKPRIVTFSENEVNIIRGNSHKGKSALIHIIDYCLGSSDCNIPINKIRDYTDTFAIHLKSKSSELFIARRNPDENDSTSIMYLHEEDKINISLFSENKILGNLENIRNDRKGIIARLNQLSGFSNLRFDNDDDTKNNWNQPVSFRDTSAFQFQTQSIIANPTTLFYKTDTYKHQNKLRTIFPLILGYKTDKMILLEKEIEILNKSIEGETKELNNEIQAYEKWKKNAYSYYLESIDLGLTKKRILIEGTSVNEIINELEKIITLSNQGRLYTKGASYEFSSKLENLNKTRAIKTSELDDLKFSLSKISEINTSKNDYFREVIEVKKNRLKPIEWFLNSKQSDNCPFCNNESQKANEQLNLLKNESEKNDRIFNTITSNEINLDKQILKLKKEITIIENDIINLDSNLKSLIQVSNKQNKTIDKIYKFIGRIEQVIINIKNTTPSSKLSLSIDKLKLELDSKKLELNEIDQLFNEPQSIDLLSKYISNYTKLLDIEDGDKNRVLIDVESLTIKIKDNKRESPYYLSRVGSGANHMGYHLATLLGLHEYFFNLPKKKRSNYIPSFLIIDQPSQVYFPDKIPLDIENWKIEDLKKNEELKNTRKIFDACSNFINRTKGKVQIIVLEHAPKITWKEIDHINLVEEWVVENSSDNNALIPKSWIEH